jgi:hypothetical protein
MSGKSKQGILSYRIEADSAKLKLTGMAGLGPYLDLIWASELLKSIRQNLGVRDGDQGWMDEQIVTAFILLNLAGGDCVDDLNALGSDEGLGALIECLERSLPRRIRRQLASRWRKGRERSIVSVSAGRRFLSAFHDEEQEKLRVEGKAFIPKSNENLEGLYRVNADLLRYGYSRMKERSVTATLDLDATVVETWKKAALYCYKHYPAYQPFNIWWAEQDMMLLSEFRDGNVPAGYEQTRVLDEALGLLPPGVKAVRLRADTAGNEHELLLYCESGQNKRFGRIEFAMGCDVTAEFKKAVRAVSKEDWHPIYRMQGDKRVKTAREWAEVCFVPNAIGRSLNLPTYRYIATREALADQPLPGMKGEQPRLPFPTMVWKGITHKVFGLVTNMDWEGEKLIKFHDGRCGKCEEAHKILKEDFGGGKLPSKEFGANAAWWQMAILAMNLNSIMKRLVLGGSWANKRMKAIRFSIIRVAGRIALKGRQVYLRLREGHEALTLLVGMREKIARMAGLPT